MCRSRVRLSGVFVLAMSVVMTSIFNAGRGSVGLMMLVHFASNLTFVVLPLLPESRGGELTTLTIFVALAVVLAATVVQINGPGSLASGRPHQATDQITAADPSIPTASNRLFDVAVATLAFEGPRTTSVTAWGADTSPIGQGRRQPWPTSTCAIKNMAALEFT